VSVPHGSSGSRSGLTVEGSARLRSAVPEGRRAAVGNVTNVALSKYAFLRLFNFIHRARERPAGKEKARSRPMLLRRKLSTTSGSLAIGRQETQHYVRASDLGGGRKAFACGERKGEKATERVKCCIKLLRCFVPGVSRDRATIRPLTRWSGSIYCLSHRRTNRELLLAMCGRFPCFE
jgi:hypothetical protein